MPELCSFAKTQLHLHDMFGLRIRQPAGPGAYDGLEGLPDIAANSVINPQLRAGGDGCGVSRHWV